MAAYDDFRIQPKSSWRNIASTHGVARSECKSVHVSAVERRHVDESRHVLREHAAERSGKQDSFVWSRRHLDPTGEAGVCLLGRDHFQKLLLPRSASNRGNEI